MSLNADRRLIASLSYGALRTNEVQTKPILYQVPDRG